MFVRKSDFFFFAWVQSLGWEDPLEEETATCSSILAWEIPWTEEPCYSPQGRRIRRDLTITSEVTGVGGQESTNQRTKIS